MKFEMCFYYFKVAIVFFNILERNLYRINKKKNKEKNKKKTRNIYPVRKIKFEITMPVNKDIKIIILNHIFNCLLI